MTTEIRPTLPKERNRNNGLIMEAGHNSQSTGNSIITCTFAHKEIPTYRKAQTGEMPWK